MRSHSSARREAFLAERQGVVGGARRDRTDDLKLAKLALSQLSYGPEVGNAPKEFGGPGRI